MTPNIVTIDIETAPMEGYIWGLFDQNVGINQIKTEWALLSFCSKSLGGPIEYLDNRAQQNPLDDSILLHRLWEILDDADFVIAQNGVSFDLKKIKARMLMHGMPPFSPVRVLDTKVMAKREFALTSNRLEWLSQHLTKTKKLKHKKYPGFDLWAACLAGDVGAWDEMKAYNINDVRATEELYFALRPWYNQHPNLGKFSTEDKPACPTCGSNHLQARGLAVNSSGKYRRYQCGDCGSWSRGTVQEGPKCAPSNKRVKF